MLSKRQERQCNDMGNDVAVCSPLPTDVWLNGTTHDFVWNSNNAYYASYTYLDLHLYYQENFVYKLIKNWTNIFREDGSLTVLVDDSWFLKPVPAGKDNHTWTMYGYYLPAGMNASQVIGDTSSLLPTPFNFTAVQFVDPNNRGDGSGKGNNGSRLPGWSIAVIVIACVTFIVAVIALIWGVIVFRRVRRRRQNTVDPSSHPHDPHLPTMADNQAAQGTFRPAHYDGGSIHSSTPIFASALRASSTPRSSGGDTLSMSSRPALPLDSVRTQSSSDVADKFRQLLQNPEWTGSPGEEAEEELVRRRLGDALLHRELAEEGTSVKYAEKRPVTIRMVTTPESTQVVKERQDNP